MIGYHEQNDFYNEFGVGLDDVVSWIKNTLFVADVFVEEELKDWALDHGFVEEEDSEDL